MGVIVNDVAVDILDDAFSNSLIIHKENSKEINVQ